MTPQSLAHACTEALTASQKVLLTLPKGGTPKGFPRGELLNEVRRNGRVERTLAFDPERVLAWLVANGLVSMQRRNDSTAFPAAVPGTTLS